MKLGELCNRNVVSVSPADPVREAARVMCERGVGAVVVTAAPADSPIAIGMLTDRDIVRAQLDRAVDLAQLSVADVMTRDPLVLNGDQSVGAAIRRMRTRGVRRAPVIDSAGTLVGMVSVDDLLAHVVANLATLAQLTRQQSQRALRPAMRVRSLG